MTTSRLGLLVGLAVVLLALASPACFVRGDAAASDSALVWSDQRAVCHEACHADEYAQIAACGLSTECVNQVESSIGECDAACDKAPSVVAPAAHTQVGGIPCELACLISEKTASLLCHAYDDAAIKAKCLSNLDIAVTICQVACLFTPIMAEKPEAALAAPVPEADDGSASDMPESEYRTQFAAFVKKYQKKYTTDEFFPRYAIFKANLNKIRNHASTRSTYSMAVNEFADMTFAEFHTKMTGYKRRDIDALRRANSEGPHSKIDVLASSVDWRQKNAVTPVKNQQQCGSCWAFSTTGSTEGAHAIKTGDLVSLSEQQLVDCSGAQGNQGCNGGMMDQGFQYIITNGGITTEDAYPYTATQGTCNTNTTVAATLSSFVDVTPGSETALMQAVNLGPVSVAIEADQQCFQFYSGGVLSDPSCGTNLDHGVLVVGYGTDTTVSPAADYWIVKNSWGESWGENGYIRLARGSNECGIATEPSYPVV